MKLLKESFNILKENKYFENNYLLTFNLPNKKHRRQIESFICCVDNYKVFLNEYLRLLDLVKKNEDNFRWDIYKMYTEIFITRDKARDDIENKCLNVMKVLLLSLITENDIIDIGFQKINCTLGKVITILKDQNCNEVNTMTKLGKILKTTNSSIGIQLNLNTVINLLEPVLLQSCFPELLLEKDLLEEYIIKLEHLTDVLTSDLIFNPHMFKLATVYCRTMEFRYDVTEEIMPIQRIGFLCEDKKFFKADFNLLKKYSSQKYYEALNDRKAKLNIEVEELITKEGLITSYCGYNDDFIISIIEDNINQRILGNMIFIDGAMKTNTDETITGLMVMYYKLMRIAYCIQLQDINNLTNKIKTKSLKQTTNKSKDKTEGYHYETIQIQPYIRKLPAGSTASEHSIQEAKRFNFVLKSNETFVSGFPRDQRYKDTPIQEKTNLFS